MKKKEKKMTVNIKKKKSMLMDHLSVKQDRIFPIFQRASR